MRNVVRVFTLLIVLVGVGLVGLLSYRMHANYERSVAQDQASGVQFGITATPLGPPTELKMAPPSTQTSTQPPAPAKEAVAEVTPLAEPKPVPAQFYAARPTVQTSMEPAVNPTKNGSPYHGEMWVGYPKGATKKMGRMVATEAPKPLPPGTYMLPGTQGSVTVLSPKKGS